MRYANILDIFKRPAPIRGRLRLGERTSLDDALLLERVIQFTDIEDTFLDVWLSLENAKLDELAAKVINAGLLFEHYLSQLSNDPTKRTPEQAAQLETFRMDAQTALDQGRAALGRTG